MQLDFALWVAFIWQPIAMVAAQASGVPQPLRGLYAVARITLFDWTGLFPSACVDAAFAANPLSVDANQLVTALALVLVYYAALAVHRTLVARDTLGGSGGAPKTAAQALSSASDEAVALEMVPLAPSDGAVPASATGTLDTPSINTPSVSAGAAPGDVPDAGQEGRPAAAAAAVGRSQRGTTLSVVTRVTLTVLLAVLLGLYPLVCASVVKALRCVGLPGTFDRPDTVWVVAAHRSVACFSARHVALSGLAIAVTVLFAVAFPVTVGLYLTLYARRWLGGGGGGGGASASSGKSARGTLQYKPLCVFVCVVCVIVCACVCVCVCGGCGAGKWGRVPLACLSSARISSRRGSLRFGVSA